MTTLTRRGRRIVAVLAGAATAVAGAAAVTSPASAEPLPYDDGSYVVLLDDPALASYTGGIAGLAATKPAAGESVDLTGAAAQQYAGVPGRDARPTCWPPSTPRRPTPTRSPSTASPPSSTGPRPPSWPACPA